MSKGNSKYICVFKMVCYTTLMLFAQWSVAQGTNPTPSIDSTKIMLPLPEDSIIAESKGLLRHELAIYIEFGSELASQYKGQGLSSYQSLGLSFDGWSIGTSYFRFEDSENRSTFFPRAVNYKYEHLGIYLSRRIIQFGDFDLNGKMNTSVGSIQWVNTDTENTEFSDRFYLIKPEVEIAWTPYPFIQIASGLGYRISNNMDLPDMDNSTLQGATFNLAIRLGYFHKPLSK